MLNFVAESGSIPALLVDPKSRATNPVGLCIGLTVSDGCGVPCIGERLEDLLYDDETVQSLYSVLEYAQNCLDLKSQEYSLDIDVSSHLYCRSNGLYISGSSLTLSYLFGLMLLSKNIDWPQSIFVTGAINKKKTDWHCEKVGLFKSKLRLAAEFGYQNFFVPQANLCDLNPALFDTSRLLPMPKSLASCLALWAEYSIPKDNVITSLGNDY